MSPRRIGVLGGTFDPVHIGHLVLAAEARDCLELTAIVLMPARRPPHKPRHRPSAVGHRLAMLTAALELESDTTVGRIDLDRPGPHFTVDMLRIARRDWALGADDQLWFLMGGDSLSELPLWRSPLEILGLARLGVVDRPGHAPDMERLEAVLPGLGARVDRVPAPLVGISGTDIRRRLAQGRSIRWHVPPAVEGYIVAHGLYRPRP